ncbi:hypothetical protein [Mesoterricola silvestris]|uniref:Uncharacterized protein n=1 Tax=Mesoterricola silvestris TaxID=2927979 RepID=A0AA48K8Z1_9BACT|nr:hypothetical protein [Mesoterricola silvestris]BDU72861.1 hypothetical protein METEAL_20350 [Mesoterricola silvestris]
MDVSAITSTSLPLTQTVSQVVTTPDPGATAVTGQVSTPAFDVALTALTTSTAAVVDLTGTAAGVDLNAEDIAAQVEQAAVAQQTVLSAMRSGADVSTLLSGLPPGATATLLGGGFVRTPAGVNPSELDALWAFHFPFHRLDVPAVTSSTHAEPTRDKDKHGAGSSPLTGYGPHGEKEPVPGEPPPSTLDIMD